jgi:hypothetical protein
MNTTESNTNPAAAIAIYRAAEAKINECRESNPQLGGSICASNLRWLMKNGGQSRRMALNAASTLEWMGMRAGMDVNNEATALRNLAIAT